jgi:hypothetical protein
MMMRTNSTQRRLGDRRLNRLSWRMVLRRRNTVSERRIGWDRRQRTALLRK